MTRGDDRPIVLTGPTGWIGSAFLDVIAQARGAGWGRSVRLFGSSARTITAPDGTQLAMSALNALCPADVEGALVVHLAYLTKEKVEALGQARFFETNMAIDDAVAAALAGAKPRALFVASSGAASLAEQGSDRNLYGVMKLLQEERFLALGTKHAMPVIAGRIFNIAGPHINKIESYAISSFLAQAFATRRIRIAARLPVYRAYLHVIDLARLVLALLAKGVGSDEAVDFCGSEIVEMSDIARAAAQVAGLDAQAIERDAVDFSRFSAYLGNPTTMRTLALRCGIELAGFTAQMRDTAAFLRG